MQIDLERPVMYNGKTFYPDEQGKAEVPEDVAIALGLIKPPTSDTPTKTQSSTTKK